MRCLKDRARRNSAPAAADSAGIDLGYGSVMTPSEDPGNLREVVAAVSAALARPTVDGGLPGIFERHVERLLSMRAVRLREIPTRYQARLVTPKRTAESIVVNVPTADHRL